GDRPVEMDFARHVHDAHATAPERPVDRVPAGQRLLEGEEESVELRVALGHATRLYMCTQAVSLRDARHVLTVRSMKVFSVLRCRSTKTSAASQVVARS